MINDPKKEQRTAESTRYAVEEAIRFAKHNKEATWEYYFQKFISRD